MRSVSSDQSAIVSYLLHRSIPPLSKESLEPFGHFQFYNVLKVCCALFSDGENYLLIRQVEPQIQVFKYITFLIYCFEKS